MGSSGTVPARSYQAEQQLRNVKEENRMLRRRLQALGQVQPKITIILRTFQGQVFQLRIGSYETVEQLLVNVQKKTGRSRDSMELMCNGKLISCRENRQKTMSELRIKEGSAILIVQKRLTGSIGQFSTHHNTKGREFLVPALKVPRPDEVDQIIADLGGNPDASFSIELLENIEHHSKRLVEFADREHSQLAEAAKAQDLKIKLTKQKLIELTDQRLHDRLSALFQADYSELVLRRCEAHGQHIKFHTDVSRRTLQLSLNGDHEYRGGRIAFLTQGRMQVLAKPAGTVTVHQGDIVHGVTELEGGVRYGLFLLNN